MSSINTVKRFFSGFCYRAILLVAFVTFAANTSAQAQATKPNILIVLGDDCTYNDLSIYGGTNVNTPRLEKFTGESMLFTNAYMAMAMCQPCRTELYSGRYPLQTLTCWNHCKTVPETTSICQYLGDQGYRIGLAGKNHVGPFQSFPFDDVKGFEGNCVALTADHDCKGISEYMSKDSAEPFCLVVGLVVPHVPWTVGDPSHFDTDKFDMPDHFVDTPETRKDYAKYLAEIEVLDQQLGDILDTLEASGKADNTIVIFSSEQGAQFPFCKWTNYNCGVHTAFVVRWPGHVTPGTKTDAMIQYVDVAPTLVEIAGGTPAQNNKLDGSSFLAVLNGKTDKHREFTYAMHNNVPEGSPYPIRSVCDGKYRYIRNLTPDAMHIQKYSMGVPHTSYWPSWMLASGNRKPAYEKVMKYMIRPAEELYDVTDEYSMHNLADDEGYEEIKNKLSKELDKWMINQHDPGAAMDYWGANQNFSKKYKADLFD